MDDRSSPRHAAEQARARAAETLGALSDRADAAMARQRERIGDLEAELCRQLDAVSAALDVSLADATERGQAQAELEGLRGQFSSAQQSWESERDGLLEQLRQNELRLSEQQTLLEKRQQELEAREEELRALHAECEERQGQCDERERELAERRAQIESSDQAIVTRTVHIDGREIELNLREHQLGEREKKCDDREKHLEELQTAIARREKEIEDTRQRLAGDQDTKKKTVAELEAQLAAAEQKAIKQREELQASFAHLEKGFVDRQQTQDEELQSLRREREQLVEALNSTSARLETAESATAERDELRHKFELALADVQRMRERTSELEQELARRPELNKSETAELVHLRGERDALAERVAALQKQLAEQSGDQSDQELSDLRRRFEMAVEDVRTLKTENAELQKKVTSGNSSASTVDSGGQDWEAQKRRLLASLSEEGDDVEDDERHQERASIEDTIRITDELVADKDREISELQAQLAASESNAAEASAAEKNEQLEELLSGDEVIQQHRARAAELEKQLQEKLRTTELELSIQRAKIAREQSELAEWRSELEALRNSMGTPGTGSPPGAPPKRRWLAKLGLGDEES